MSAKSWNVFAWAAPSLYFPPCCSAALEIVLYTFKRLSKLVERDSVLRVRHFVQILLFPNRPLVAASPSLAEVI